RQARAPCTMRRLYGSNDDDPRGRSGSSCPRTLPGDDRTMSRPIAASKDARRFVRLFTAFALPGLMALGPAAPRPANAQVAGGAGGRPEAAPPIKAKPPGASQVFQRDAKGRAAIPIELDDSSKDATVVDAAAMPASQGSILLGSQEIKYVDGKLVGVPVGG